MHKLILECIEKLRESGFTVHVITSDGAQWNRGVWSRMGIDVKKQIYHVPHPLEDGLLLHANSDFPHLIKTFRTGILNALKNDPNRSFYVQ